MKRNYLLLIIMMLFPIVGWAENSRLMKSFTWTDGKDTDVVEMKYDDKGRLTEFDVVGKLLYSISYNDNTISIKEKSNSNYSDTYDYTISEGRIVSGKTFLDADYVDIDRTFTYNSNAQLVSIVKKAKERGYSEVYTTNESWEWSGSNLSSWNEKDEEDTESSVFTYNSLTAEPVIRAMFGFSQFRHPEHFFEIVAIYPYLGSLPQNLFEKIKHHDAEGRDLEYLYSYKQNADGDITQVTIDNRDKSYVFTFEWADSGSQPSGIKDVVDKANLSDDYYYNMYGVRVTQPRKGVYIHHGRKVVK